MSLPENEISLKIDTGEINEIGITCTSNISPVLSSPKLFHYFEIIAAASQYNYYFFYLILCFYAD